MHPRSVVYKDTDVELVTLASWKWGYDPNCYLQIRASCLWKVKINNLQYIIILVDSDRISLIYICAQASQTWKSIISKCMESSTISEIQKHFIDYRTKNKAEVVLTGTGAVSTARLVGNHQTGGVSMMTDGQTDFETRVFITRYSHVRESSDST